MSSSTIGRSPRLPRCAPPPSPPLGTSPASGPASSRLTVESCSLFSLASRWSPERTTFSSPACWQITNNPLRDDPAVLEDPPAFGEQCQRSEEHTSELQSLAYLVCRLLLEKKKK